MAEKGHRAMRKSAQATNEMLRNLSTVREFAREAEESTAYERTQRTQARDGMALRLTQHMQWPIFISIFFLGQLTNLWAGAALVHAKQISAIDLIQLVRRAPRTANAD